MMPTLSSRRAPFPPRDSRPADFRFHKGATFAVAIIIIGLTTAGCGRYIDPSAYSSGQVTQRECVSAVYTVLSGMVAKPDDDQPFENFLSRYGTASPTYTAYRDSFDPFYNDAVAHGIKAAEQDVRTTVTRDCAAVN